MIISNTIVPYIALLEVWLEVLFKVAHFLQTLLCGRTHVRRCILKLEGSCVHWQHIHYTDIN